MSADSPVPRVLITGADGMLGADLCPAFTEAGFEVDPSTLADMDITDAAATRRRIETARPDIVIHAAAYTNVDGAEDRRDLCMAVNADGAANVARACRHAGARMVLISTDYVFDGKATTPYAEDAAVGPRGAYAESKALAEARVREILPDHLIVRIAWLQGVHCWKFTPNFIEKIVAAAAKRPELRIVADQRGGPTFTFDVARVLPRLAALPEARGIYHLTCEGEATWLDLARAALEEAGVTGVALSPTTTAAWGAKAPRPLYTVLSHGRLYAHGFPTMPHWRDSLREYFRRRPAALAEKPPAN